jgi:transglutaminase-like putative cysteine protease
VKGGERTLNDNNLGFLIANLPEDVEKLVDSGEFEKANKLIDIYLQRNISGALKERLNFERYRMEILKKEYIYDFEMALKMLQEQIKDFEVEELERLKEERYADWININGKVMFHKRFLENIPKTHPSMKERLINKPQENEEARKLQESIIKEIIEKGEKSYFIHLKTGIKFKKGKGRLNETVRVHLPIPQKARQIKNIKILNTSHIPKFISPETYPQRTIYFEEKLKEEESFTVEYSYENHVKYIDLDYNKVLDRQPNFYTSEWPPQIVFTPFLKDLAREIVKDEKNQLKKARKIYDYITQNVIYSYVRPYVSIINIPEYAAYNLKGDCGVQALLFITLCRIVGIPAKWQSGLYVDPYSISPHDWAQFYVEPFGWCFADLSFGGSSLRKQNEERWNFYFGNLDPFRMVANSEFHYNFYPPKHFLRLDPYDNQIGEAEYFDKAIDRDDFEIIMEKIEIREI